MRDPEKSLELTGDQLRELVNLAMERIIPHIDSLSEQPAWNLDKSHEIASCLDEELPTNAQLPSELFDSLFESYIPASFNTAGPGYLGYVPGGGLLHSAVADLIASAVNRLYWSLDCGTGACSVRGCRCSMV